MSRHEVIERAETEYKHPFSLACKLAFLMGFHQQAGGNSSLLGASENPLYDKKVLPIIFGFIAEIFCLEKMVVENSIADHFTQQNQFTGNSMRSLYNIFLGQLHENYKVAIRSYRHMHLHLSQEWSGTIIEHEAKMIHRARQESVGVVDLKKVYHAAISGYSLCLEEIPSLDRQIKAEAILYPNRKNSLKEDPLQKMSWRTRLLIALKVAKILEELHAAKIIHGQIRSHHILFDEKSGTVKLTDFTHAHIENDSVAKELICGTCIPDDTSQNWCAPEELRKVPDYSRAIDIYGMGNLLYELATGSIPCPGVNSRKIVGLKLEGMISKISEEKCPQGVRELIKLCWSFDPKKRPTASELIEKLNILISSLPKEGASIEEEFAALNHSVERAETEDSHPFSLECKLAFLMGFHHRLGKDSSLLKASKKPLYDRSVLRIIFRFIAEIFRLEKIMVKNSFSQSLRYGDIFSKNSLLYRIYLGQQIHEDYKVAMKVYTEYKWNGSVIEHEAKMILKARQESMGVVDLKQIYDSGTDYSLCLEEIPSLERQIKSVNPLEDPLEKMSWRTRLLIALKVAKILKELHAAKIIHRQIRSHHILFDEKSGTVKLTDFANAHIENDSAAIDFIRGTNNPNDTSRNWRTPEELSEEITYYSTAIDIYGMGNLLYELATGSAPFSGVHYLKIPGLKREGRISEISKEKCPQGVRELIQLCWPANPKKRLTASGLIEKLNILISSLAKEGASIAQEFAALNHRFFNSPLISPGKGSFLMESHPTVGENSPQLPPPLEGICKIM
jgi:serine/threonine protein kinase